ncbi:MAG TPA: LytTR family DNA-binding domain-containing protein [Bacteroidales bacterium]|nr:LytTR family DNA-binding domain-containing protein [Bacteroidales bacterium]
MKVLIVEDENFAAERLQLLLKDIIPDIQIYGAIDSVERTIQHLKANPNYDLLFLDIQLADGKSFSIFEKINITIPVIFTTAYDEYAIKAFEVNSIDYLLKPISKEKLIASIEKFNKIKNHYAQSPIDYSELLQKLTSDKPQQFKTRFLVSRGDSLIPVSSNEIAYFCAEDGIVFLVTNDNKRYIINHTLEDLECKLNPSLFFRINRQFIVAFASIQKAHNYFNYKLKLDIVPDPQTEVIVSKTRTAEFKQWMNSELEK